MEIPAENNGTVKEILVSVGDTIKTGQTLLKIESLEVQQKEKKEEPQETKNSSKPEKDSTPSLAETIEPALSDVGAPNSVFASPGVRRLSRELGINLETIKGTGDKGRITKDDLNAYIKMQMLLSSGELPAPKPKIDFSKWGNIEKQKLTKIQRITGKRLQSAWQSIPHVTQFDEADITKVKLGYVWY
jgi:pyruvate dehydrogenase E2 component (dihydrolipoamide acetyltransferase)